MVLRHVREISPYNGNEFVEHLCDSIHGLNGVVFSTIAIAGWVEI